MGFDQYLLFCITVVWLGLFTMPLKGRLLFGSAWLVTVGILVFDQYFGCSCESLITFWSPRTQPDTGHRRLNFLP